MAASDVNSAHGISQDRLLGGRVLLKQPKTGYRAGIDAVFLAASCGVNAGDKVLDVGAGTGAATLCLKARVPDISVICVDINAEALEFAKQSAELNELAKDVAYLKRDVLAAKLRLPALPFDVVLTNPPFHDPRSSRAEVGSAKERATVLSDDSHEKWFDTSLAALKTGGSIYVIFRADRIDLLLSILRRCTGGIHVVPLWPKAGLPAKRVLVRATKGSKAALTLHSGIILHEADGSYTKRADAILRHGEAIDWDQV